MVYQNRSLYNIIVRSVHEGFEYAVVDKRELTAWFRIYIQSGAKYCCAMSGILFLLEVDWVTKKTIEGRRSGIWWDFTSALEDLDFAEDIALLASKYEHIQE